MRVWARNPQNVSNNCNNIISDSLYLFAAGCCIYSQPKSVRHDGDSSDESSDDESGWNDCCHEHKMAGKRLPHKHPTTT